MFGCLGTGWGTVWEGLGGVWPCLSSGGLFVKGESVGMGFEVSKILHPQCLSLAPAFRSACGLSAAPTAMPLPYIADSSPLKL